VAQLKNLQTDLGHEPTPKVEQGEWTVDKVIAQLPDKGSDLTEGSASPLPFLHLLERLKTTRREGWRRFGITKYIDLRTLSFPTKR